ncbi:MAG TPA: HEAT repeat domain-containing protein [Pyrinomonadaceae bacterium]|nr:HEAT repeat domain-containing protein [Pyrinomonadaceae bacterium]
MKYFRLKSFQRDCLAEKTDRALTRVSVAIGAILFCAAIAGVPEVVSHAQRMYVPVKVSNVSSQTSASGSLVTIAADNSLARAQTWQDEEGFHVVLPNTISTEALKPGRGVRVRRVGSSLEIVAHTRPGTRVSVSSAHNQLSLVIDGKLEGRPPEPTMRMAPSSQEERSLFEDPNGKKVQTDPALLRPSSPVEDAGANSRPTETESEPLAQPFSSPPVSDSSQESSSQIVPAEANIALPPIQVQSEEESVLASIFSGTSVLIVFGLGVFGLLVSRKIRSRQEPVATNSPADASAQDVDQAKPAQVHTPDTQSGSKSLVRVAERALPAKSSSHLIARMPVAAPTSLYGAYRIDQEVGKLVLGQPHRIDVLASRAIDDRRAIETSLIKGVNSTELDEKAQSRARGALEEYGFVARQCAALLLAPDAYERSSAARALGEIKSPMALPFLLEGLYDSESIVRNQAVMSIGELKLPSAIGALLDIARTHPDVPSSLLSRTLSACSVEGLDFFDAVPSDSSLLGPGDVGNTIREITHLEPSSPVESLPAESEDQKCAQALLSIETGDITERSEALKTLVQFRVQSAVDAIAKVARHDPEPTIRSLAISSLGSINHESVFATVLIGMADESREVRAAAARSVNRLSFDRADAYVRVIETGDDETLACVAKACIQAGIVSQNLDRLTYADHRQAYETFSLICLLTKAGMNEPVLEAVADHPRMDVRLKAVHLLGCTGHPETFGQLRELAVKDGIGEVVKTALLEAMYKLDQSRLTQDEIMDDPHLEADLLLETEGSDKVVAYLGPEFDAEVVSAFEADVFREADELEI